MPQLCDKNQAMTKVQIHAFFSALHAQNPNPKSDLNYTNAYTLLVAVALSAQGHRQPVCQGGYPRQNAGLG
jgi:endonuclease III